ncbi:MAG: Phosphoribosyl 1,2-cyclic phosphodiesterase [Alphaproteobacteria bacterium]|nr:Phosphoribosyl 1,2-cyclic phosphodiesterase [Alphaproteobacteria bacterium]MDB5739669.1 Phosphoribosyl 1,2-cyclic phosphodiesterase [Alphaproteobacteria bacterium]
MLEVRILGCGSSGGVPRLGEGAPNWGVCDPAEPKNARTRCSILVTQKSGAGETRVLVDTSPDLRAQLLAAKIGRLDGVLITHDHADQTHGMDDLRVLTLQQNGRMLDLWSDHFALDSLHHKFSYIFESQRGSGYPPIVAAHQIPEPFAPFAIDGPGGPLPVLAMGLGHGRIRSLGFRFGSLAYCPDVDALDEAAFAALSGLDCWIVDALRMTPHPSHAHLERTLSWIARVQPRRAILTNMHIDMDYETLRRDLPPGVEPAYDGMTITL